MLVENLVRDTEWYPQEHSINKPKVSVLMPTFRRGKDGMFYRAARSVIDQSFKDLELIIIDDASTDGTKDLIRELMLEDKRISCLSHPKNIGLPAISEYEAFMKSRGDIIAFAFDDFVFDKNSFEHILDNKKLNDSLAIYGESHILSPEGSPHTLGSQNHNTSQLEYLNYIGNSAIFIDREIFHDIGLYDPHVAMARVCDWDLWRRLVRKFKLDYSHTFIGQEYGFSRGDSLGNTYPMVNESLQEFMNIERDDLLSPENFHRRDILKFPPDRSITLENHLNLSKKFLKNKSWYKDFVSTPQNNSDDPKQEYVARKPYISIYGIPSASVSLYISPSNQSAKFNFGTIEPSGFSLYETSNLLRSDAVIFVRDLFDDRTQGAINFCKLHGIPHLFFVDDNFTSLVNDQRYEKFSISNLREQLVSFSGVIVTSEILGQFYTRNNIHSKVFPINCLLNEQTLQKTSLMRQRAEIGATPGELRIASFGGPFRNENLVTCAIPELEMSTKNPKFMTRIDSVKQFSAFPSNLRIPGKTSSFFNTFLENWVMFAPHAIFHGRGETPNIKYKSDNVIIVSSYLGALPVVCDEPAYSGLGLEQGVIKINGERSGWRMAIDLVRNKDTRLELLEKLYDHCRKNYGNSALEFALDRALSSSLNLSGEHLSERYRAAFTYSMNR